MRGWKSYKTLSEWRRKRRWWWRREKKCEGEEDTQHGSEARHRPRNSWGVEGSENCHVNVTAEPSRGNSAVHPHSPGVKASRESKNGNVDVTRESALSVLLCHWFQRSSCVQGLLTAYSL